MTAAQITRAHPDMPHEIALVAVLGETLDMAKNIEITLQDLKTAENDKAQVEELLKSAGLQSEIKDAQAATRKTIVAILDQVSEQDLQAGLDMDLLSIDDHREALIAKRKMELERGQSPETEPELER